MTAEPSSHVTAPTAPPQLTQRQFGGARLGPYRYVHASTAETAIKRTGQYKSRNSCFARARAKQGASHHWHGCNGAKRQEDKDSGTESKKQCGKVEAKKTSVFLLAIDDVQSAEELAGRSHCTPQRRRRKAGTEAQVAARPCGNTSQLVADHFCRSDRQCGGQCSQAFCDGRRIRNQTEQRDQGGQGRKNRKQGIECHRCRFSEKSILGHPPGTTPERPTSRTEVCVMAWTACVD